MRFFQKSLTECSIFSNLIRWLNKKKFSLLVFNHTFGWICEKITMKFLGPFNILKFLKNSISTNDYRERSKYFDTWFVVIPQNATKCMFPESTCLKTNFGTYLEFLIEAVAEKFLGEVDQFCPFFAFSAIYAFTQKNVLEPLR